MTIKQKQCLLAYLGYYEGDIDSLWGDLSWQATIDLQHAHGLEEDGDFGDETLGAAKYAVEHDLFKVKEPPKATTEDSSVTGTFWEIDPPKYFTRAEFRCPCGRCGGFPAEPKEKLVRLADQVREHFGNPVTVSSGVRCQAHNDELPGSVPNSRHLGGGAMDFCVSGFSSSMVLAYVSTLPGVSYAYAIDSSFVHMDIG